MRKHGWKNGKGLGKNEDGMTDAIKVKIKADNAGIGLDPGEQFSFHWWEHVFEKSAKNITVKVDETDIKVVAREKTNVASTKKPSKLFDKKMLYGRFIKAGTLDHGKVEKEECNSSSSEEEEIEVYKKSAMLNDEELLKACGGRTAHKAARHGVYNRGKLARLLEQEQSISENNNPPPVEEEISLGQDTRKNKKNKKGKKRKKELSESGKMQDSELNGNQKKRKKSKRDKNPTKLANGLAPSQVSETILDNDLQVVNSVKKKKKKRSKDKSHT